MKKQSPKEEAMCCHTIVVLASLLAEYTNDLTPGSTMAITFKEQAEKLMPYAEKLLVNAYDIKEVRSGTYLNELSNKIDTIIRKNFERII